MTEKSFDVDAVILHFQECLTNEGEDVDLIRYVQAYEELSRLFDILGMIFSFVESDVKDKREILKKLHNDDVANYSTVRSMINHEMDTEGKPKNIGARTLLRLHRALEFIVLFVQEIHLSTPESNISHLFKDAYDKTLAQHHGWFVRKTVGLAAHAVPNRDFLVKTIFGHGHEPTHEEIEDVATRFIDTVQSVYDRIQVIYKERDLLNLP
uniref:Glycolipid transfer protein domain-containing protein n=2 Tax=Panagrolaimus sp. JU765 TaxID=591449 RepID=A0AC34QIS2_9BILA